MTHLCPRCSLPFDTAHSAAQHLWKSTDEAHEDAETLDSALETVIGNGKSPDANRNESPSDTVIGTVTDTVNDEPSATVNEGPAGTARTDGGTAGLGLAGPPERDDLVDEDDVEDATDDPTVDCPSCGGSTGATADDLEVGAVYQCDCGGKFRWT